MLKKIFSRFKKESYKQKGENKKFAIVGKNGEPVTGYEFEGVGRFIKGTAIVKNNNKYGVVNQDGEQVIPCIYNMIVRLKNDFYAELDDRYLTLDSNGNVLMEIEKFSISKLFS